MANTAATRITVQTIIEAPVAKVWELWTVPDHIINWNNASDEWHTPSATNDLREGGSFTFTMAAKDGSASFDFGGKYGKVSTNELIEYSMADGREVSISFQTSGNSTTVVESFDPEQTHSLEMQQVGWQAILDNFKKYVEGHK